MTANEDALAAVRRKRDEYRTKWAALVEVLEDLGDPNPDGESAEPDDAGDADAETGVSEADEPDGDDDEGEEDEDEPATPSITGAIPPWRRSRW